MQPGLKIEAKRGPIMRATRMLDSKDHGAELPTHAIMGLVDGHQGIKIADIKLWTISMTECPMRRSTTRRMRCSEDLITCTSVCYSLIVLACNLFGMAGTTIPIRSR